MKRFEGQGAVITGGAGFIGSRIAKLLASEGCSVAIVDCREELVKQVADDIQAETGSKTLGLVADVKSWEEALEDEQAWANDVYYKMDYPTGNQRVLVRQPIFIGNDLPDYKMAPLLGEHSEEILKGLGYTDEQMAELHEQGIYNTWDDLKAKHGG